MSPRTSSGAKKMLHKFSGEDKCSQECWTSLVRLSGVQQKDIRRISGPPRPSTFAVADASTGSVPTDPLADNTPSATLPVSLPWSPQLPPPSLLGMLRARPGSTSRTTQVSVSAELSVVQMLERRVRCRSRLSWPRRRR